MTKTTFLLASLFAICQFSSSACSIYYYRNGDESCLAANEDWSDPFTKMWVSSRTESKYGSIQFGHSDFQTQAAINEFGLCFDFATIPQAMNKRSKKLEPFTKNIFTTIIQKCRNVGEALLYLKKYKYPSLYQQVLLADANGNAIIANADTIIVMEGNHLGITNFNVASRNPQDRQCQRFDIIEDALSGGNDLSKNDHRSILSRSHQEGNYPTQYSYIFDLKRLSIQLYSFHNYIDEITIDIASKIAEGFEVRDLKNDFLPHYEEIYFRSNHKDSLKIRLVKYLFESNETNDANKIESGFTSNPRYAQRELLWEVASDILSKVWIEESQGQPFELWWYPQNYLQWTSNSPMLNAALQTLDYAEDLPTDNPMANIGIFELKGLIHRLLGQKSTSEKYYQRVLDIAPEDSGNHHRAELFLAEAK